MWESLFSLQWVKKNAISRVMVEYMDVQQRPLSDCVSLLADLDHKSRRSIFSWWAHIISVLSELFYPVYPKYLDTVTHSGICPKFVERSIYWPLMCLKTTKLVENSVDPDQCCILWTCRKQCRPRSDAAECGIWSGSKLLAQGLSVRKLGINTVAV